MVRAFLGATPFMSITFSFYQSLPHDLFRFKIIRRMCKRCYARYESFQLLLCPMCGETFNKHWSFHKHVANSHPDKIETAYREKCVDCNLVVKNASLLKKHLKRCPKKPGPYTCNNCNKSFDQEYHQKLHELTHEPKWVVSRTICPECGVSSKKYRDFEIHSIVKHGKVVVTCPICGFWTRDLFSTKNHMDEHLGIESYLCDVCYTYFLDKGRFYLHMHQHEKDLCPKCLQKMNDALV